MTWLALSFALQHAEPGSSRSSLATTWTTTGSLVHDVDLHVGARPAVYVDPGGDWGVGLTIQVSTTRLP